jgi:hypothetical protein
MLFAGSWHLYCSGIRVWWCIAFRFAWRQFDRPAAFLLQYFHKRFVWPFKAQWPLDVPQGFTLRISVIYPCSALCFLWFSERTAIFLIRLDWFGYITQTRCVYWAVRTESVTIIRDNLRIWHWQATPANQRKKAVGFTCRGPLAGQCIRVYNKDVCGR